MFCSMGVGYSSLTIFCLQNGGISVRKRDASESLKVSDASGERRSRSRSGSRGGDGKSKFTNADLPLALGNDKRWQNVFCHTMFEYMGILDDPWSLEVEFIRDVWQIVFPDLEHDIKAGEAVFYVVSHHYICSHLTNCSTGIATSVRMAWKVCAGGFGYSEDAL